MWINCQITICIMLFLNVVVADNIETNTTLEALNGSQQSNESLLAKVRLVLKVLTVEEKKKLKLTRVSNKNITCNDGSAAGYYLKRTSSSKKWIVYLQGGGFCSNLTSCQTRWQENRDLMTSFNWTEKREGEGILSSIPAKNPFWHNANHVFIPYCSSDSWTGTKPKGGSEYAFMGALIIEQVIRDLAETGLKSANSLILAGSSAGGTGVMLNVDRVKYLLQHKLNIKHISVRGICDSGWFLEHKPYSPMNFSPIEEIKNGISFWQSTIPKSCTERYPNETWRCFFGYRLYPYISVPLFIFQWLYDEEQLSAVNIRAPNKSTEWDFVYHLSQLVRETFEDVSAVFAPSCISHNVLTKPNWSLVKINDISLPHALYCWDKNPPKSNNHKQINLNNTQSSNKTCAKLPRTPITRSGDKKRNNKNNNNAESNDKYNDTNGTNGNTHLSKKPNNKTSQSHNKNNKKNKGEKHKRKNENLQKNNKDNSDNNNNSSSYNNNNNNNNNSDNNNNREENNNTSRKRKINNNSSKERRDKNKRRKEGRRHNRHGSKNNTTQNGRPPNKRSVLPNKRKCIQGKCSYRLIETCLWPHCNHACPKLMHPDTHEEVKFLDIIKSFGADLSNISRATGIDEHTLNNMEHTELINLLTQRKM